MSRYGLTKSQNCDISQKPCEQLYILSKFVDCTGRTRKPEDVGRSTSSGLLLSGLLLCQQVCIGPPFVFGNPQRVHRFFYRHTQRRHQALEAGNDAFCAALFHTALLAIQIERLQFTAHIVSLMKKAPGPAVI